MDDLISRQAAIDIVRFECGEWRGLAKTIENGLNDLPSAQPEVMRCGECKNHIDGRCIIANHHTSVMDNCGSVMGAERSEDG